MGEKIVVNSIVGRWTVLSRVDSRWKHPYYSCRCDCGVIKDVAESSLRSGDSRSCGCYKSDKASRKGSAARRVYAKYVEHAKEKDRVFEISFEDFIVLSALPCFYCGIEAQTKSIAHSGETFVYNGLDRVDNFQGYTADNVVPCCTVCNRAKLAMTQEEFFCWIDRAYVHLRGRIGCQIE